MKNILIIVLIICGLGFVNKINAQTAGTLDQDFGTNGEVTDPAIFPYVYSSLALSPGGECVVSSAMHDTIQVIRLTSAGNRDINFGLNSSGLVQIAIPGFSGIITTSMVQTDQKILIAGQYATTGANKKAFVLRLNESGTIDNTFGNNGWVFFNFFPGNGEFVRQIALQTNGNIVALDVENYAGVTDTFVVTRIKSNGTYDSTFATNGIYQVPFYNLLATSPSVFQLGASNDITFAAYSNYNAGDYFYLFRLNHNGVPDASYGNGGSILIDSTNIINGGSNLGLNFQSDGKLITVQTKQTGSLLWAVCRYNTDGSTDENFGNNGMVSVLPNLDPVPYNVHNIVSTASGQILTAGIVTVAGNNRVMVNKFNADGGTDVTFGNNQGSELLNCFELDDYVYNMLVQPDNKILINGLVNEQGYQQFELVQLIGSTTTSVKPVGNNFDFSVYPNPTGNQLGFQLPEATPGIINLKDVAGNIVLTITTNNATQQTVDVSMLPAGIYMATWLTEKNVVSKKIVKQ